MFAALKLIAMKKLKTMKKKLKRFPAKKYLSFPTLALVVTFAVACGKQDSSTHTGATETASSAVAAAAAAAVSKAEPSEPVPTLPEWCDKSGGFMHNEHLCEVQMKKMYGRNMMVIVDDWWASDVEVKANDTIQVVVTGKPRMRIGGDEIAGAVSRSYVVKSDGMVSFQSRSLRSKFEVREITAKRCYDEKWQLQVCPKS
jgi:hypothetical protein